MALVTLDGTPLVPIGHAQRNGTASPQSLSTTTLDAVNEATITVGHVFTEDGNSHTIDTTGSSAIEWRSGTVTFANAATTVKVGLAAVDTGTGPPSRAANVADVITFDVSAAPIGGSGTITANAWHATVPTAGTMTIANGDLVAFAVQMTARGGVDVVNVSAMSALINQSVPGVTDFTGGAYAYNGRLANTVITFSDGKLGFFYGGSVCTSVTTQTWNNTSGTKEYGNFIQFPVPVKAHGIRIGANFGGDADVIIYSDPLGTPASQGSRSIDLNVVAQASVNTQGDILFASPVSLNANTPYAVILKPTSATNVSLNYKSFNASSHQKSETLGTNCYAVSRNAGAFAAVNSSKDRFAVGLLVGAFEHGVPPTYLMGI